jgi:catechol-2,3-dioxygenase
VRALPRLARRVYRLVAPRFSDARSATGQRVVLPPPAIIRAGLRNGLQHIGFRVPDEAALRAAKQHLEVNGVHILWAVNHGDLIKGLYFRDAGGNLCEIFCDGPTVRARQEELARTGAELDVSQVQPGDLRSYDLDLTHELAPSAPSGRPA